MAPQAAPPEHANFSYQNLSNLYPFLAMNIMLEIGEMVISVYIGLVGLGAASRVFTFHGSTS